MSRGFHMTSYDWTSVTEAAGMRARGPAAMAPKWWSWRGHARS